MSDLSKGAELADNLTNFVNSSGSKNNEFIDAFLNEHRTLQQSSLRLILQLIEKIASDDYPMDGRNEASHDVAKKLLSGFKHEIAKQFREQGVSEQNIVGYSQYAIPSLYLPTV